MTLPEKAPAEIREKLKITEIQPDEDQIASSLGISEKRFLELTLIAELAYKTNKSFTKTMADASEYARHANELGMLMIIIAKIHLKNHMGPMELIAGLVRGSSRSSEEDED